MNIRVCSLLLLGALSPVLACSGDDSPALPITTTTSDAAVVATKADAAGALPPDGGVASDAASPRDSAVAADSAVPMDAATNHGDGGMHVNPAVDSGTDSGARDSGSADTGMSTGVSAACTACQKTYCAHADINYGQTAPVDLTAACAALQGSATSGPKTGTAKSKLCQDYVDCAHRTQCNRHGHWTDCLCGADADFAGCYGQDVTGLPGKCRAEVLAAAETLDWSDLNSRVIGKDPLSGFAVETADILLECEQAYCFEECYGSACAGMPDGTACGDQAATYVLNSGDRACKDHVCPAYDTYGMLLPDGGVAAL
ncbi:MAG: hypothetical protein JWN04_2048 [Myxococcaceae bacterium]|nr:hypothetical protein [Myxococcaceae bacterium]